MTDYRLSTVDGDAAEQTYAELCSEVYAVPMEDLPPWFERCGRDNMRLLLDGDDIIAGLMLVPMGLWLGGCSVPMNGVAGVAVRPDRRGAGAATALMTQAMHEMRADGFALSGLNASTLKLYRGVGYEYAWSTCEAEGSLETLGRLRSTLRIRREKPEDRPALKALYDSTARRRHGALDRGPYIWARMRSPKDRKTTGYVAEDDGGSIRGFMYLERKWDGDHGLAVAVTDWFASDHGSATALLSLLANEAAMASPVRFPSWPNDPLYAMIPERGFQLIEKEPGLVRVLDVAAAFGGRGYHSMVEGRLELDVADDVMTNNAGRWTVTVADGAGTVTPGGAGALKVDARGLAPLLTGHLTPESLRIAGHLSGADEAIEEATALLAGPPPALPEFF